MAKGLKTLVRMSEWTVDEKRRSLGVLLRQFDELETSLENLEKELVVEQRAAAVSPHEAGINYGRYAASVISRREYLNRAIQTIEKQIVSAREDLSDAYLELKKYEVAENNRKRLEEEETDRREALLLDDIGIEMARRRGTLDRR